ncbi:MAG: hypothetical protein NTW49_07265 [Bacteroidia bacterium]|nr:hypothetical protein [Bacteroidia bacterium]
MKRVALVLFLGMAVVFANAQTKTSVKTEDLPKAITDNIAKDFKDYKIQHAFKVDTKGVFTFEVMVKKEAKDIKDSKEAAMLILTYDATGKLLKKDEPKKTDAKPVVKPSPKPEPKKDQAPTTPTK